MPLDLRFLLGEEIITGYRFGVRVAPLAETVMSTLDALAGTLRDLAIGFDSRGAIDLAGQVAEMVIRRRGRDELDEEADRDWRVDLEPLIDAFVGIANEISNRIEDSVQQDAVEQFLQLMDVLQSSRAGDPYQLIEQMYELIDRVQQPAGRLVLRQGGR
jgi:hypothetical protein